MADCSQRGGKNPSLPSFLLLWLREGCLGAGGSSYCAVSHGPLGLSVSCPTPPQCPLCLTVLLPQLGLGPSTNPLFFFSPVSKHPHTASPALAKNPTSHGVVTMLLTWNHCCSSLLLLAACFEKGCRLRDVHTAEGTSGVLGDVLVGPWKLETPSDPS